MISFSADKQNNHIIVKMAGTLYNDEISKGVKRIFELCSSLKDGFTIINDISTLVPRSSDDLILLNKISTKVNQDFKVGLTIRVIGKSKDNLLQLSKLDGKESKIHYVPSMQKAIELSKSARAK